MNHYTISFIVFVSVAGLALATFAVSSFVTWIYKQGHTAGRVVGTREEHARLLAAAQHAHTAVTEDGCLGSTWVGEGARGEFLNEAPSVRTRAKSRDLAQQILRAQGEEGAIVAEAVLDEYRRREARLRA